MKIKSVRSFRKWYKNLTPARKHATKFWDENFIGTQHNNLSGFFAMYHGDKTQIYDFLRKEVGMAEDGQAIYEFVQNAADSDSTKFYMFYNENYLIVINNGSVFSKEGIKSILNIGQSFGKQDHDKIGRYGIGFKLVHRLVGKSSGLDELLNIDKKGYRGPILFSWSEKSQFNNFLESEEFEYVDFNDDSAPWLLKILITNFPAEPFEQVKDIDYNDIIPFKYEELKSFQAFLNSCKDKIDLNSLDSGSMFFLKLGDKKFEYLERQKKEYLNGLSTSMHFLKSLDTLVINEDKILKDKEATNVLEFIIPNGSDDFNNIGLTEIRDKESDAKFKICFADNAVSANEIKKHPNIYKYFPAVKEVNNLSFVIHSNLFELSSNRQNLTETPINKNLLELLSKQVINKMEHFKYNNRNTFKNLFISILMSEKPSSNYSGNGWQSKYFYNILLEYIQKTIPTKDNNFSNNTQNVKIKKLKLNLNLSDFGLSHMQWFEWDNEADRMLIEEAKKEEKLNLEEWDIRDIVENADLESINNWIANCDKQTYEAFLKELENSYLREETKNKIRQIKLFKFSDGKFLSINDVIKKVQAPQTKQFRTRKGTVYKTFYTLKYNYISNAFFKTPKTEGIVDELGKIGIILSEISTSEYPNIFSSIKRMPEEKQMYNFIAEKCKTNTLSAQEKKKLFLNLINEPTKFDNVGEATLKDLQLFCNRNSEIKPLNELIGDVQTPSWLNPYKIKQDEYFDELDAFLLSTPEDIFEKIFEPNQDDIIANLTTAKEIEALIKLYQDNQKSFFKEFIIRKDNNRFVVERKTEETYQVQSADKKVRKFIDENCADNLFVLPYEFVNEYKDEEGIIKADDLYNLILEVVDVDEHKETLVDFIKYSAKYKFLQKLSEFRFNPATQYTQEDYEYKILDLACSELKESDYQNFQDKVVIETDSKDLKLSEIPPFTDKIKIGDYELSLAKIFPDNYENSDRLSSLVNQFVRLGLNEERIKNLFGISEDPDPEEIFSMLSEKVEILENAEQLAFLFLYGLHIENIDFEAFKAYNVDNEIVNLRYDKYVKEFDFLKKSEILHSRYGNITSIFKEFPVKIDYADDLLLIKEPFFEDSKFICPYIKEDLSDEEKLSLVEFLLKKWKKEDIREIIRNIDWSKIDDEPTEDILGFNPRTSVYPNEYACESEVLPEYIIKWIDNDETKIDFLSDLGVWTENSVVVDLRKYLKGEIKEFKNNRLAQEERFSEEETNLFNSFKWLKEKEITLESPEQFETFNKIVETINENRTGDDLIIQDEYDFEKLKKNSTEWEESHYKKWKENSNVTIFLYDGEMPKTISLDEIDNYVFYRYDAGNYAVDEGRIFINKNVDEKKTLQKVAADDNNDFSFEDLWKIYEDHSEEIEKLKQENARLKQQVVKTGGATLGTENRADISKNDQKEANREARKIVKEKLEKEGFEFTQGIGEYSVIDGVIKDGIEYPLVVKSYIYKNEPLKIGANEWIQLMKPNAMFFVHLGDRKIKPLKLYDLLKNQDKITITFSTKNLDVQDRLDKFAEILRYFEEIHFNFDILQEDKYSIVEDLSDYRFDERRNEEDLSSDDESIL